MPRLRSAADLREHVRAAHVVVTSALARLQAEPSEQHLAEFEWATRFECSKRDELDAAIASEATL